MSDKTFKIVNGDLSDGYHTFDELYEHRIALFLVVLKFGCLKNQYVIENHFEGWDLIGGYTPDTYAQVTYHVPIKYRQYYQHIERRPDEWDGHTPAEVVDRLLAIAKFTAKPEGEK